MRATLPESSALLIIKPALPLFGKVKLFVISLTSFTERVEVKKSLVQRIILLAGHRGPLV